MVDNFAIFCGSKFGSNPLYKEESEKLCALLGQHKKHIIYGGGNAGLMGVVADKVLENGGTVTGIIPAFLNTVERIKDNVTELIVTETMHERKQLIFKKSDAAIILPGGYGTMDELFEMLTWNQLELHAIKIFILNVDGFYDALLAHIHKMAKDDFLYFTELNEFVVLKNGDEILHYI
jgi:hypothetical protein